MFGEFSAAQRLLKGPPGSTTGPAGVPTDSDGRFDVQVFCCTPLISPSSCHGDSMAGNFLFFRQVVGMFGDNCDY